MADRGFESGFMKVWLSYSEIVLLIKVISIANVPMQEEKEAFELSTKLKKLLT